MQPAQVPEGSSISISEGGHGPVHTDRTPGAISMEGRFVFDSRSVLTDFLLSTHENLPILFTPVPDSVNQMLPSGPATMSVGALLPVGMLYSVMMPVGVMRAMLLPVFSTNQRL